MSGELRESEQIVQLAPPSDDGLRFFGRIRTPWATRSDCPQQGSLGGSECRIALDPVRQDALDGLDVYGTIEVLYWLD
jgi:tRNA (Thr-GGU) A37 N-methylase